MGRQPTPKRPGGRRRCGRTHIQPVPLRITFIYLLLGTIWIVCSDRILNRSAVAQALITRISMIKGLSYVLITGIFFFILLHGSLRRLGEVEAELLGSRSQMHTLDDRITQLALADQLTRLPNRTRLLAEFAAYCQAAERGACLLLDLDNFKLVNDIYSHDLGDQLLLAVVDRIRACLPEAAFLARVGGDDFVILLAERDAEAVAQAEALISALEPPFLLAGHTLHITASIGIARFPEHGLDSDEVLSKADAAMYRAKARGKRTYQVFDATLHTEMVERLTMENQLRSALQNGEFSLCYQPQVSTATGTVTTLEALLRWHSPVLGPVSPARFVEVAEDSGLIIPIGEWVLRQACRFVQSLRQAGWPDLTVSINISVVQLAQPGFVAMVQEVLQQVGLPADRLELEITESRLIESFEFYRATLTSLLQSGIQIALDDFGKGYSSLYYLRYLPISTLKIDKVFLDDIVDSAGSYPLLESIILLGHKLGLAVVAEGVERPEQVRFMSRHGCDRLQGYLFCRPLPAEQVRAFVERSSRSGSELQI